MKNVNNILTRTLFIDIETVSRYATYSELPEQMKYFWDQKAQWISNPKEWTSAQLYEKRAAIYAEFGKIICVSIGAYYWKGGELQFKTKSFSGFNEEQILTEFSKLLRNNYSNNNQFICGHNIKEFDVPYICRRMLLQSIEIPKIIDVSGRKPWELHHLLDTMNQWKFGDYKHYTSLEMLCALFDISSPKSNMNGEKVGEVYWKAADLLKIQAYCEADVKATAQLFIKLNQISWEKPNRKPLYRAS